MIVISRVFVIRNQYTKSEPRTKSVATLSPKDHELDGPYKTSESTAGMISATLYLTKKRAMTKRIICTHHAVKSTARHKKKVATMVRIIPRLILAHRNAGD
jgi:hypothetical protein